MPTALERTPDAPSPGEVTDLLRRWSAGEETAGDRALGLLYGRLRRIAAAYARGERPGHTLPPTAVVHESLIQLLEQDPIQWDGRGHFLGIVSRLMRRVLVDHARHRGAEKRGGRLRRLSLSRAPEPLAEQAPDLVALDDALADLESVDPLAARVVELRFFVGLTLEETADRLGVSRKTVVRRWRLARAWLFDRLARDGAVTPKTEADCGR